MHQRTEAPTNTPPPPPPPPPHASTQSRIARQRLLWVFLGPPPCLHRVLGAWSGHSHGVAIHPTSSSTVSPLVRARLPKKQVKSRSLSHCSYYLVSEGTLMSNATWFATHF